MSLIVKGARQIGKTDAIRNFGMMQYKSYIEINFILQPEFSTFLLKRFLKEKITNIKALSRKSKAFP